MENDYDLSDVEPELTEFEQRIFHLVAYNQLLYSEVINSHLLDCANLVNEEIILQSFMKMDIQSRYTLVQKAKNVLDFLVEKGLIKKDTRSTYCHGFVVTNYYGVADYAKLQLVVDDISCPEK